LKEEKSKSFLEQIMEPLSTVFEVQQPKKKRQKRLHDEVNAQQNQNQIDVTNNVEGRREAITYIQEVLRPYDSMPPNKKRKPVIDVTYDWYDPAWVEERIPKRRSRKTKSLHPTIKTDQHHSPNVSMSSHAAEDGNSTPMPVYCLDKPQVSQLQQVLELKDEASGTTETFPILDQCMVFSGLESIPDFNEKTNEDGYDHDTQTSEEQLKYSLKKCAKRVKNAQERLMEMKVTAYGCIPC
jgi:hypothetical protein